MTKKVAAARKIHAVMSEYKRGVLKSGAGRHPKVTNRRQAVAIALSEARNRYGARAVPTRVNKKKK